MTCDEYQEQVSQYIDRELADDESQALFEHLSTCSECRSFLRSTLELRSKIHDEMLVEAEGQREFAQRRGLTFTFVLPLAALILSLFLVFQIAEMPIDGQERTPPPGMYDRSAVYPPIPQSVR